MKPHLTFNLIALLIGGILSILDHTTSIITTLQHRAEYLIYNLQPGWFHVEVAVPIIFLGVVIGVLTNDVLTKQRRTQ